MQFKKRAVFSPLMKSAAILLGVACLTLVASQGLAQSIPVDPQVTVGKLPNGLTYYIRPNPKPAKRAELRLVVNAGSVLEDSDQQGLAHFVEHMAFNGTKNFPKHDITNYLERIGMRFGPDVNAMTSYDETIYMLTVPTDTSRMLQYGLDILKDWADGLTFDSTEIERERGVVLEEWRIGQGADERIRSHSLPLLLSGSKYAVRLPIGDEKTLRTFSHAVLRRFYNDWYRPDLMAVVAVGDFDPKQIESWIKERFCCFAAKQRERTRTVYSVPNHRKTIFAIADDPEETSTFVTVYHKMLPSPRGTERAERQRLIERLYNAVLNARFREIAQQFDPPFIDAESGRGRIVRSIAAYTLGADVRDGGFQRALDAMLTEAERIARYGATSSELEREKANLLRRYQLSFDERANIESSSYAGQYIDAFLQAMPMPGIQYEYEFAKRMLPTITLADVNAIPRSWVRPENRVVWVTAPRHPNTRLPAESELAAALHGVRQKKILAYVDSVSSHPLMATRPGAAQIVSEKRLPDLGIIDWKLSNGVRVVLKPTAFKADEVLMQAFSPGGTSLADDSNYVSAKYASSIAAASGAGAFDATTLQKKLSGKFAMVSPYIGEYDEGLGGVASTKDLETLFQLTHLYIAEARRDTAAFASYMRGVTELVRNRGANPEWVFWDTVNTTMNQHHFRRRVEDVQLLNDIRLNSAMRFYRDRFADASDFTFIFVGSFNIDSIRPLVTSYLGSLPSKGRVESWRDEGVRPPKGVIRKVVRRGLAPKALTQIVFTGPLEYDRENVRRLSFLRGALDLRLRESLREDQGGTYGVDVTVEPESRPTGAYRIAITFGSAPERADSLAAIALAEIERLKASGPSAEDVVKLKAISRRAYETNVTVNGYWRAMLEQSLMNGLDASDVLRYPEFIAEVNAKLIQESARKYLDTNNYGHFTLLPKAVSTARGK